MPDYSAMNAAFPQTQGKYIKIKEVGDSYQGTFSHFNGEYTKDFGNGLTTLFPAQFIGVNEAGEKFDQQLDCGKALIQAFEKANVQEGDHIRITKIEYQPKDGEGNPVINSDGSARMLTGYDIQVIDLGGDVESETPEQSKKKNAKAAPVPADDEINIDDIPF